MVGMLPRPFFPFLIAILALLAPASLSAVEQSSTFPTTPPEAGREGWVSLFDGRTLDGWRGFRMDKAPEGWRVQDGVLMGSGKGGNLASRESYADFELYLEWKVSPGGNSGIILRVSEQTKQPWHNGPEMQVLDDIGYQPKQSADHSAGALYDLVDVPDGVEASADTWHRVFIRVVGTRYTLVLNDTVTADLDLASEKGRALIAASKFGKYPKFGHILDGLIVLQAHGDPVSYRNVRVRRL